MASVYKRKLKDGEFWYARLRLSSGKWISYNMRIPTTLADSERKAQRATIRMQAEIDAGREDALFEKRPLSRRMLRFGEMAAKYVEDRCRGWSPKTRVMVEHSLRLFVELIGDLPLADLNREKLLEYRERLIARGARSTIGRRFRELSPHSVNIHLRDVGAYLRWIEDGGIIQNWKAPKITMVRAPLNEGHRDHFSPDEIYKLMVAARGFSKKRKTLGSFIGLLLLTGMRRNEAAYLQWEAVDLKQGCISLRAQETKTRRGRYIPITEEVRAIFEELGPAGHGRVFPGLKPEYVSRIFPRICIAAGIRRLKLHNCRDTFAANAVLGRIPTSIIQRILGHADIRSTTRYYLDWDLEEMKLALSSSGGNLFATAVLRGLNSGLEKETRIQKSRVG
ncbi:MAG: site-specific integrase [bacterium]